MFAEGRAEELEHEVGQAAAKASDKGGLPGAPGLSLAVKGREIRAVLPHEVALGAGSTVAGGPLDTGNSTAARAVGSRAKEGGDAGGTGNMEASEFRAVNGAENFGEAGPVG